MYQIHCTKWSVNIIQERKETFNRKKIHTDIHKLEIILYANLYSKTK